jgi:zinc protease
MNRRYLSAGMALCLGGLSTLGATQSGHAQGAAPAAPAGPAAQKPTPPAPAAAPAPVAAPAAVAAPAPLAAPAPPAGPAATSKPPAAPPQFPTAPPAAKKTLPAAAAAPSAASKSTLAALPIQRAALANGLRVVLSPDRTIPTVGIAVYYDVGSRNEVPGRSGFAHLFEHMMFQGSANVAKGEHFQLILNRGGQMNGTTSEDRTNY